MADNAGVTTIQLKTETRDFLRLLQHHTHTRSYDELLLQHIIPLIEKEAGHKKPERIAAFLLQLQAERISKNNKKN